MINRTDHQTFWTDPSIPSIYRSRPLPDSLSNTTPSFVMGPVCENSGRSHPRQNSHGTFETTIGLAQSPQDQYLESASLWGALQQKLFSFKQKQNHGRPTYNITEISTVRPCRRYMSVTDLRGHAITRRRNGYC